MDKEIKWWNATQGPVEYWQEGHLAGKQEILDQLQAIFADQEIAGNYWAVRNRINDLFRTPPKGGE